MNLELLMVRSETARIERNNRRFRFRTQEFFRHDGWSRKRLVDAPVPGVCIVSKSDIAVDG